MTTSPDTPAMENLRLVFDADWYGERYPDARGGEDGALAHYVEVGDAAGHWPHPLFDPEFYSEQHPELARESGARLEHYVQVGEKQGSWPNGLFDPLFYLRENPDLAGFPEPLLVHFSRYAAFEIRRPNLLFDLGWYRAQRNRAGVPEANPLIEYMESGDRDGLSPHPLFDPACYGSQHPELPAHGGARLAHYLRHGGRDGSNPHPLFRSGFYLEQVPELAESEAPLLVHYLSEGEASGLAPNPLFSAAEYRKIHPDLANTESLLLHYSQFGAEEGRAPNPIFSPDFYREQLRGGFVEKRDLLAHYLDHGDREGLLPHPLFDPGYYAGESADAAMDRLGRLGHYLRSGGETERDPHPLFQSVYYSRQLRGRSGEDENLLVHYLARGEAELLKPNPLFDPAFYCNEAGPTGSSLLEHYVLYGGAAGLSPSQLFDSRWVRAQIPRSARSKMNPLEYYFREGGALEKDAHPLFSASWYESEYPDFRASGLDALSHFIEIGAQKGFDPHPLFGSAWYRDFHGDAFEEEAPSIFHYLEVGEEADLQPNPLFDAEYYCVKNRIHLQPGETAFGHFCREGIEQRHSPSRLFAFCLQFFRDKSPDRRERKTNPLGGFLIPDYSEFASPGSEIGIRLPQEDSPDVSIIIPMHGQITYTLACLRSISRAENEASFEVIVVDDHSPAAECQPLSEIENLKVVRNSENLGFLRACNRGAQAARGRDLLILNNDTLVTDYWIDRLVQTRIAFPEAGLIGSRLIFPSGVLQEAGSIVWRDGSAFNYGHGEDASDPRFGFARKCDYVSAAAVLIEAGFFEKLGGFDERYAPAFYEDTDLAFRVREAGRDVVCQPKSTVIHFGGASHGRDVSSGLKRYQISNQKKFRTRWKNRLASHYESDSNLEKSAIRLSGPRALVIDATMLMPDRDAGSLRMFNLIKVLQEMGFAMTFLPSDLSGASEYVENLQQSGIQVACLPHVDSVETYLQKFGSEFELCILSRPDTAEKNLDHVNLLCPNALVLYDTVDVHFLRRERELRLTGVAQSEDSIKKQELRAVRRAAGTIAVSEFDRGKFLEKVPNASIHVVSLIHEVQPQETPFSERDGILFIGGFQHGPNADAVLWFLNDIFPTVRSWIPDIRFHIVGTNPPDEIRDRACDHIIVEGFVEDVEEQFASRRLSIAPLRYGSGVKGKINQSMAYGLPCVATHTAVEGMDLKKDSEILVAEAEHEFAEAVAKLYQNEELWTCLARNSVSSIERSYSAKVARQGLVKILEYHGRELPKSSK